MESRCANENKVFHPSGEIAERIPVIGKFSPKQISAGVAFTGLALLIWILVHGDFGATADEPVQSRYGEAVRNHLAGNVSYDEFLKTPNLPANIFFYGPTVDLVCATLAHIFHADIFSVRHGVQGLMWVAMFYPVCALGRKISGRPAAWFSGLALLGMPSLFGHAFNNPKDLPLACATIWLLHTAVAVGTRRGLNRKMIFQLGGAVGFVLAMRPGAWFLGALLGLVPLAKLWRANKISGNWNLKLLLRLLVILFAAIIFGWLLMILPWPSAWHSPLRHPIQAAGFAAHFAEHYPVLLRGTIFTSNQLPWDYLLIYVTLTLPLPLLVLGLWGHVIFIRKFFSTTAKIIATLGVLFVLWFPLVVFIIVRPNVYDGMRHFLFILPPIAVLAGVAAAEIARKWQLIPRKLSVPAIALLLLAGSPAMLRLHPYENVFFNMLAGPKATLNARYETDYWFSSYREAAHWINEKQSGSDRPLHVLVAGLNFYAPVFLHYVNAKSVTTMAGIGDLTGWPLEAQYDYYVATERYGQTLNFSNAPIVHVIARDGIVLTVIRAQPQNPKP